jgi:ABC-2 type transport system ATP-binding protein
VSDTAGGTVTEAQGSPSDPALVSDATVTVDAVSKWFGQKVAVSGVSCSFGPGVTGLLGPNGAGKTTLLRMLTGLVVPSEGSIEVLGRVPRSDPSVYRNLGLVPEENAVYEDMTATELIRYAARLSGVDQPDTATSRVIAEMELEDAANRNVGGFSKGMRQRAKVAAALVSDPEILVLDEPLNGTDPVQRHRLIALFRRLGSEGRTVIVSSHVLQEVERMTDRVLAMVDGKLAAAGDITAIRSAMADIPYRVLVEADEPRRLAAALVTSPSVTGVAFGAAGVHIETNDIRALGASVPAIAADLGLELRSFRPEDDSLESVFRYLVHRR